MADKKPVRPKIGTFAPEAAFLPALARLWLAEGGGHDGLIILPSRRAAQALSSAFLQANADKAMLLPRIVALGNIDEAGLLLLAGVSLPPAVESLRRQALLARLILQKPKENGVPQRLPAAWALAAEFASLLDEADHAEVDLAAALPELVPDDFSEHWQKILEFLNIVTQAWPAVLAAEGVMNPAKRLATLIKAQASAWEEMPPAEKIWMVAAEGTPAIAKMARVISRLPNGRLILPGFDPNMDDESWQATSESHAQNGMARLLVEIDARHEDVELLEAALTAVPEKRSALVSRALLPAASLAVWQEKVELDLAGLSQLETGDEAQNAIAIAMLLRNVLQKPGKSAALVTPDRALAARVAAALKRFGVTADDSAGERLATTPPAVFMRLLARAAQEDYAPLPLLALLKHPLAAGGWAPQDFREMARRLERAALRGPRPPAGLAGLRLKLTEKNKAELEFLTQLEGLLEPLVLPETLPPAVALAGLIQAAEKLASSEAEDGAVLLWSGEAGAALSSTLTASLAALADMPDMPASDLPDLLDALISGQVIRKPRTKDGHPRIAIWGLQEAALQTVDVVVLGGLVEGVWPSPEEPGPWLSRPMRKQAGLPNSEIKIGQAAHAFFSLACACPQVVFAMPKRRERAPVVPARWLTRLNVMLAGQGKELPSHEAASWVSLLDQPLGRTVRQKPTPRPPAESRPKIYSISDVATLMADPYAIYASKILKLSKLDQLDEENDASQFGDIVHKGLAKFFEEKDTKVPDALLFLTKALEQAMQEMQPRKALAQWWRARLGRIAEWLLQAEDELRDESEGVSLRVLEQKGEWHMPEGFVLKGRADRIERDKDGLIRIIDYKTGKAPPSKDVKAGTAPQLLLEAVMVEKGAFGEELQAKVKELLYVELSGRSQAGNKKQVLSKQDELPEAIKQAEIMLPEILKKFSLENTAFLASPHPLRENKYDDYAGVSRLAEWEGEADDLRD